MEKTPNYEELVFDEIMAMDKVELERELKKHRNGDIATALLESGSLNKNVLTDFTKGWVEYEVNERGVIEFVDLFINNDSNFMINYVPPTFNSWFDDSRDYSSSILNNQYETWELDACKIPLASSEILEVFNFEIVSDFSDDYLYNLAA